MKINKSVFLFLAMIMLIASCRKEIDDINETPIIPDPIVQIEGSVIGLVQDENLNPIEGAVVKMQGDWVFTDENGLFNFKNKVMPENGAFVQVEKDYYFPGSRVFYPRLGEENQVSIQLIEKKEVGSFQTSQDATITFEGVEIDFLAEGIVTEGGELYQGEVHVVAKYLDPTLDATHVQMPGDLTAFNEEGELVALTSFAMMGVELLDDNGDALQLAEGKACTVKVPVPESLQSSAPDVIPLWYFDEEIGRWIEEGEATLENGIYIGKVEHFTFWNCDIPRDYTTLQVNVNNTKEGIVGLKIRITDIAMNSFREDITNANGDVSGIVPAGTPLLLEIISVCGENIYTEELGLLVTETDKTIEITSILYSTITGIVSSCGSSISETAYVKLKIGNEEIFVGLEEDNSFETTLQNCGSSTNIIAAAYDPLEGLVSQPIEKPFGEEINLEGLTMCDTLLMEHLYYTFGDEISYITPENSLDTFIMYFTQEHINDTDGTPLKVLINVVTLNWMTGHIDESVIIYDYMDPENNISLIVGESGFIASGTGDSYITQSGPDEFFVFTGTLTDFEITNDTLWNPDYDPFTYKFVVKKEE